MLPRHAAALAVLAVLTACKDARFAPPTPATPATEAEARAIGAAYVAAMVPCDEAVAGDLFDYDALARQAVYTISASAGFKEGFVKGVKQRPDLCGRVVAGDRYALLGVRADADGVRPIIRILGETGVNYEELVVGKARGRDDVRIRDLYLYTLGEHLSESIRGLAEGSADSAIAARIMRMRGAIESATGSILRGDATAAAHSLDALPAPMQRNKSVLLLRVTIGGLGDEAAYLAAIEAFEASYPGDPALDLVSIDGHFLRKDWPAALAAIDRLDARVGGDPYLETLRANVQLEQGDGAAAIATARRATVAEPALDDAWWALLTAQLRAEDHDGAAVTMGELEERVDADFDPDAMAADPLWATFLTSDAYRRWSDPGQ